LSGLVDESSASFVHAENLSLKKAWRLTNAIVPTGCGGGRKWTKYQNKIAPERLVFIDETRTKANMAPIRGRAPLGIGLKAKVPHGRCRGRGATIGQSLSSFAQVNAPTISKTQGYGLT
jgi:hypothetical protein